MSENEQCSGCRNFVCVLCQHLNAIKNKGKPYEINKPYNIRHCKEHCEHEDERHLVPEIHLVDRKLKTK